MAVEISLELVDGAFVSTHLGDAPRLLQGQWFLQQLESRKT